MFYLHVHMFSVYQHWVDRFPTPRYVTTVVGSATYGVSTDIADVLEDTMDWNPES